MGNHGWPIWWYTGTRVGSFGDRLGKRSSKWKILLCRHRHAEMASGLKYRLAPSPFMVSDNYSLTGYMGLQNKDCFPTHPSAIICKRKQCRLLCPSRRRPPPVSLFTFPSLPPELWKSSVSVGTRWIRGAWHSTGAGEESDTLTSSGSKPQTTHTHMFYKVLHLCVSHCLYYTVVCAELLLPWSSLGNT